MFTRLSSLRHVIFATLTAFILAQPLAVTAASVELVCPCSAAAATATSVELQAGVRNSDSVGSGALRLRLLIHDAPSFLDSSFNTISTRSLSTGLAAGAELASQSLTAGLVPAQRVGFSTLVLDELVGADWVRRDSIRLLEPISLSNAPGGALLGLDADFPGAVYLAGTPTISLSNPSSSSSSATISLPAIVNSSPTVAVSGLSLQLRQSDAPDIFSSAFVVGSANLSGSIAPASSMGAQAVNLTLNTAQGRFIHLLISTAADQSLVYETVLDSSEAIVARDFVLNGIELLGDSDGDGVSDFNEAFSGTDPNSAASRPGVSTIDLLVLYSAGVAAAHNDDALARIDHIVAVSNQIYQDSGVDIHFRLAHAEQRNLDESISNTALVNQMFTESAAFSGLGALKESVGADIAIAMRPMRPGDTNCGIANLGAVGLDGDFSSAINAARASTALYSDCRDRTTPHELGHIMGLNHSRIENARDATSATFAWSTGHGVQNNFATVMANINDFGGFLAREVNLLSNPELICEVPNRTPAACGVQREDPVNGADAVTSLNATRFQVAAFTPAISDFGDTANTALSVPVNGTLIEASFGTPADLDFFAITAVAGRSYRVATTQLAVGVDTVIEVTHLGSGVSQDDDGGEGSAASLEFEAANSGVHIVRVSGSAGAAGSYALRVDELLPEAPSAAVQLVAAVLPASRSVELGVTATVFVTMINAGSEQARNCSIVPNTPLPIDFFFQPTDPLTNALVGVPNQAMSLDPGAAQAFLVGVTPTVAFDSIDMQLRYVCDNSAAATVLTGINTLRLSASDTPVPDIVALAATTTGDGVVHLPPGFFTLATVNVGSAGSVVVTADTDGADLPLTLSVCETNSTTGACINPVTPAASLVTASPASSTQTFAVFVAADGPVGLDPAQSRVFVRFTDEFGVIRGSTSVAVQTDP